VKLSFELTEAKTQLTGERMWVKVTEVTHMYGETTLQGVLDNNATLEGMPSFGTVIDFKPVHICGIFADH